MTRINLLPWREARRAKQQRDFISMLVGAAVIAVAGVFAAHLYVAQLIDHQQARNQYLQNEIDQLKKAEQEIKLLDDTKAKLLSRLEIIQNLQRSRPVMVKIFDALARQVPQDVYLANFKSEGNRMTMTGTARSDLIISQFLRELERSDQFGEPVLTVVSAKPVNNLRASSFELAVSRAKPPQDEENNQ